jgi:uncharacterized protein YbjT (DUF2867 family)
MAKSILIIGGTGAQGAAVVRYFSSTDLYEIKCTTRDTNSGQARELASLPHVTTVPGGRNGCDELALQRALQGVDYVWVNTNGFALGEQAEMFWGVRIFELSLRAGAKHFVHSGMNSAYKLSGYDPECRSGHYEGRAKVSGKEDICPTIVPLLILNVEWILSQPTSPMAWTIINPAAYNEMLYELFAPRPDASDTYVLTFSMGDGTMPTIYLYDLARYTHWAFQNQTESNGLRFVVATSHVTGQDMADSLTAVTGKRVKYQNVPNDTWLQAAFGGLPKGIDTKIGFKNAPKAALLQTYGEDVGNWFNIYRGTYGNNTGILTRDYAFLDRILPDRVKSLEDWVRKVGYTGEVKPLLKDLSER